MGRTGHRSNRACKSGALMTHADTVGDVVEATETDDGLAIKGR